MTTQIYIERPLRLRANIVLFSQIKKFLDNLNFTKNPTCQTETTNQPKSNNVNDVKLIRSLQPVFDLNIHFLTSQIVVGLELDYENFLNKNSTEKFSTNTLFVSLSSLNLFINRINNTDEKDSISLINGKSTKRIANNASFHLSDFQSKIQLVKGNHKENIHFLGPTTFKSNCIYLVDENELYSNINIGSVIITFNKKLFDFFSNFSSFFLNNQSKEVSEDFSSKHLKQEEPSIEFLKHDDDLRNGTFKYTVIDESFLKLPINSDTNNLWLISHVNKKFVTIFLLNNYFKPDALHFRITLD